MTWTRSEDGYYLDSAGYTICRINYPGWRCFELWRKDSRTCIARRWCATKEEATLAIAELKELAK